MHVGSHAGKPFNIKRVVVMDGFFPNMCKSSTQQDVPLNTLKVTQSLI
jgi:hypothetical protein